MTAEPTAVARGARYMPRGTGLVAVGIAVNAGAAYGHLAAAGRSLSTVGMSGLSLLWTIAFSAGIGLFFPLEQELTRAVAARVAAGEATTPLLRRGARVAATLLAAAVALIAVTQVPLSRAAFNGDTSLLWSLAGALTALAATHTVRGLLAGHGLFAGYAAQLTLDGVLRLSLSATLLLTHSHSPTAFALILTAAPMAATLAVLPPVLRATRDRKPPSNRDGPAVSRPDQPQRPGRPGGRAEPVPPARRDEIHRGLTALICAALLAQALANAPILAAKSLAPGDAALVTALLCALTLVRIPQFVVGALQAALLRDLAERAAHDDRAGLARGVSASAGGLVVLGVLCTVPAALAGPTVTERLLAAPPVLGHADFALLGLGTTGYLLAYLLGNGTLATGGQRPQLLAWATGTAVTAAALLLPYTTRLRVEYAYAAGSWTAAVMLAARLVRLLRRRGDTADRDGNTSETSKASEPAGATVKPGLTKGDLPMPEDTTTPGYTARLLAQDGSPLKRLLPTQAPYRWNLRRLRLGRVLDVGCGVGRNLRNCDPGSVGVDHNEHSVAAARARGLTAYTPEEFGRAAGCGPGSFDSLLVAHVLEHLDEDTGTGLLATYLPYVRPGGRAVFITPQEAGYRSDATHVRFVGFAELTEQARAAGLTVRRSYSFPLPRPAGRLFRYNEFVVVAGAPAADRTAAPAAASGTASAADEHRQSQASGSARPTSAPAPAAEER